jgi:hypothetical protein
MKKITLLLEIVIMRLQFPGIRNSSSIAFMLIDWRSLCRIPISFGLKFNSFLNLEEIPLPEEGTDSKNVTGGKGFRYVYRWTIQPIKEKQPELYETLLESSFLKFSRKALISLFGKAEKDSFPIEIKERLAQEFDMTYRYLDSLGLSWKKKSEKEISS